MPISKVKISHNLDLGPELPNEILDIARKQGENPDRVCADIQELRDMIYEKGYCNPHRTDDDFLIRFLRARFFKVENAYKLLCRYYEFRDANPDLHVDVHPFRLKHLGEDDIVSVAPYRDQLGRRIMIYKIGNWRPSKVPLNDIFKSSLILFEMGALEPQAQVLGGIGIFDLEGLSLNQAWYVTPSVAKKIISLMVTCMPVRTNAIHIINNNWAFDMVYQMFKPFINERMRERLFVHGTDLSSLHKYVSPSHLPQKYGGDLPEYPYTAWMESLAKNSKIMEELKQLGYIFDPEDIHI